MKMVGPFFLPWVQEVIRDEEMVAHGVGVRTRIRHVVKRIDEDYFEQETF